MLCSHCFQPIQPGIVNCHSCGGPLPATGEAVLRSPLLRLGYDERAIAQREADKAFREETVRIPETDSLYLCVFGLVLLFSIGSGFFIRPDADFNLRVFLFLFLPSTFCLVIHRELFGPSSFKMRAGDFFVFGVKSVALFTLFSVIGAYAQVAWHDIAFMAFFLWTSCWINRWGDKNQTRK